MPCPVRSFIYRSILLPDPSYSKIPNLCFLNEESSGYFHSDEY